MPSRLLHAVIAAAIVGLISLHPASVQAQQTADVIRGHVVSDSGKLIVGGAVIVTRGPDRMTLETKTDSAGNFSVRFEQGTGDYLVYVSSPGLKAARRRVQRQQSEREMVANFTLSVDLELLAATKITAVKPARASNTVNPYQPETGASEKWSDGVKGQVPPTIAGDLNAIAGSLSSVTMAGGVPSILGSGAASNLTTLNGMGLAAGSIPRAARTETRVTGATFDATRGGFAGANVDVRLGPGDRNYQRLNGFVTLDPPVLQFTDATTRSLGATSGGVRTSFGADGELIRKVLTYNVALDLARSTSEPVTLLDADADALLRSGVSPDSVARLVALAGPMGLPLSGNNVPSNRLHDGITWLGRLDDTRDTMQTRALTTYAGFTSDGALGFSALAAPSSAGERHERTLGTQLTFGTFVGPDRMVLTETRIAASAVKTQVSPYRSIPGASVLVRSSDAIDSRDLTAIALGGSSLGSDDNRWTAEGSNETIWNAVGRRHRFKAMVWARVDGLTQQGVGNQLGTFSFNSVADFAANQPSSFTRTLTQPARDGTVWNAATAMSHQYAPTRVFSILYGARLEADGFASSPAKDPALEQALGVVTGAAPMRLHISPRVGFSYTYNRDKDNGSGMSANNVGRFYRTTTGVIRGGVGEFRDILRPNLLADASAATGLPGGTSVLSCVGSATPTPNWSLFSADPTSIPTTCLNGSGALGESAPSVTLIDPKYDVPRSWRASLEWTTSYRKWLVRISSLASYDLSQPGIVDANFAGVQKQTLAEEGNRPVFVSPAAIDPASGTVSASESRTSSSFGRVSTRVSDLRGYGEQLTFGLSPDVFKFHSKVQLFTSMNYTIQSTRRQFRGFDGANFGDPRVKEWAAGPNDARHVVVLTGGFSTPKTGTWTLFARGQSGLPFTPIVQGDPNGDGRSGDRAFIPDPALVTDPALATQLRALLSEGSPTARACIESNLGRVAVRNGCRGPWTESLNLQWRPPLPGRLVRRVTPNVYFQNVLAGLDQALHGAESARGWGSPAMPDPVLLVPRAFVASAPAFRYDVNARFADTRPRRTLLSDPFRIVIDFSVDLAVDYDLQQLRRAVEPVKGPSGWTRRNADSLTSFYLSNTSSIHKLLLSEADSLFLSAGQVAALRRADSVFSAQVRAVYAPLGEFLAAGNGGLGKAALDSAQATQKAYWHVFWLQPEVADSIVTPAQKDLMPMLKSMVSIPMDDRLHSQWQFQWPVQLVDKKKP